MSPYWTSRDTISTGLLLSCSTRCIHTPFPRVWQGIFLELELVSSNTGSTGCLLNRRQLLASRASLRCMLYDWAQASRQQRHHSLISAAALLYFQKCWFNWLCVWLQADLGKQSLAAAHAICLGPSIETAAAPQPHLCSSPWSCLPSAGAAGMGCLAAPCHLGQGLQGVPGHTEEVQLDIGVCCVEGVDIGFKVRCFAGDLLCCADNALCC